MIENKRYEALASLPAYGPMYIPIAENGDLYYSEGFAVRFCKSDGEEWVGNFKKGSTSLKAIIELTETDNLIVVAYGACYLVNVDNKKADAVLGSEYEGLFETTDGRVVLHNPTQLTIIEPNGNYWHSERISVGYGLKNLSLSGSVITGIFYNPTYDADEWVDFNYDIDTRVLTEYNNNPTGSNKKPWWQFW